MPPFLGRRCIGVHLARIVAALPAEAASSERGCCRHLVPQPLPPSCCAETLSEEGADLLLLHVLYDDQTGA